MGLLTRHWNDVNATLRETLYAYEPLVLARDREDGRMLSIIDEWCVGYYKGSALDQATWSPLMVQHPEWFTAILLYGTEAGTVSRGVPSRNGFFRTLRPLRPPPVEKDPGDA